MTMIQDLGTHYHPETKTIFTLGKCENCERDIQEANAVTVVKIPQPVLDRLKIYDGELPYEIFWDDELGMTACEGCNGE